jgi:hypothetical protein
MLILLGFQVSHMQNAVAAHADSVKILIQEKAKMEDELQSLREKVMFVSCVKFIAPRPQCISAALKSFDVFLIPSTKTIRTSVSSNKVLSSISR